MRREVDRMATPTVLQLQLGKELKRLREARGWTLAEAVEVLGNKATKLSRLENGQSSVRPLDIRILYEALGATREETAWAIDTARLCNQRGRWSGYRSIFNQSFRMAVDLEEDAFAIHHYQSEIIPGLLQTEEYMRAIFAFEPRWNDKVDEGVRARLERQRVLTKPEAPQVGFVLSESAVARVMGDDQLMRDQLRHIAEVGQLSNVDIWILPFRAKTFPVAAMCSFTIFRIPSRGGERSGRLGCVYTEDYYDGRCRVDQDSVNAYIDMWRRFVEASLDPIESREVVLRLADGY
jgi:transcriptional regulator with XRE-family HTH domain